MQGMASHTVQSRPEERRRRPYFTDPGLARRLAALNAGCAVGHAHWRHDNILYDSETGKITGYYAEDQRAQVHEHAMVVRVHVASWVELVITSVEAADQIGAVLWLINRPTHEWHAISVPIGHGRLLWIPTLDVVRGLIAIGDASRVRMQWGAPSCLA
jgi:hypothetical protein